jgi:prepilin-type N-terminal cleavage/methylation domain-containing protein
MVLNRPAKNTHFTEGFHLIEMIASLAIVGILAAIAGIGLVQITEVTSSAGRCRIRPESPTGNEPYGKGIQL